MGPYNYPHIRIDIFESGDYPVVSHIFYGKTIKEAQGYLQAHMATDEFMRGAIMNRKWRNLELQVVMNYGV